MSYSGECDLAHITSAFCKMVGTFVNSTGPLRVMARKNVSTYGLNQNYVDTSPRLRSVAPGLLGVWIAPSRTDGLRW